MKKIALVLIAVFALTGVQAQIETPQPSPFTKMEQKVGLTDVTLEYSRPSARGREVFGNLVPFSKLWRTGANKNTVITFSNNVTIGGKEVKAGSYAIFTKPGETSWEVIFYADTNNWGTPREWDQSKVAATIKADVVKMPMKIETFTMTFDDLTSGSAVLGILWEDVYVGAKFEVPTDKTVSAAIAKTMNGPSAQDYYAAAVYYKESGKDINQAKTWMEKAMSMMEKPAFYQLRQLSLIYAKAGDKKKAIETAKKSLVGSKAAGNADYVKMNEDSLKEWGAK
ncbi:MAG: DUF2911 domain-containing protein [Cellulophaga sp.]|uniref:DUF2911 domain-containing protein n=2 Tax=Cellulophaga TaxID=104264 RepID=UPI000C2BB10F|nr:MULTISPECIES: DUF2911 domain-containing protein [unclassified Cellulophaga]MDO6490918.1 DUF2911 domain-containing protein [Cellulophaga sp. 2_MG-2023]MDO6493888.1 DUF2911 domain-containing protein [Cellulophaga sp. 3_MG-2023]PKB44103.1 Protein of unknown function (DUF2911) [Cellulophaga sp. RHA19]